MKFGVGFNSGCSPGAMRRRQGFKKNRAAGIYPVPVQQIFFCPNGCFRFKRTILGILSARPAFFYFKPPPKKTAHRLSVLAVLNKLSGPQTFWVNQLYWRIGAGFAGQSVGWKSLRPRLLIAMFRSSPVFKMSSQLRKISGAGRRPRGEAGFPFRFGDYSYLLLREAANPRASAPRTAATAAGSGTCAKPTWSE